MRLRLLVAVCLAVVGCHLIGDVEHLNILEETDPTGAVAPATTAGVGGSGGTATTGTTGGGGEAAAPPACDQSLCDTQSTECSACVCRDGECACDEMPMGQPCAAGYCFSGDCVPCIDDATYPCADEAMTCQVLTCVEPTCTDGTFTPPESDVDCGGPCGPCALGRNCNVHDDCISLSCQAGVCGICQTHADCADERWCDNGECERDKVIGTCNDNAMCEIPLVCCPNNWCNLQILCGN